MALRETRLDPGPARLPPLQTDESKIICGASAEAMHISL